MSKNRPFTRHAPDIAHHVFSALNIENTCFYIESVLIKKYADKDGIPKSELPCGRDRRASENCMFIFGVIPACRESFDLFGITRKILDKPE